MNLTSGDYPANIGTGFDGAERAPMRTTINGQVIATGGAQPALRSSCGH